MDTIEARALERAMDTLVRTHGESHRFTAADIRECHRMWLGEIYEWAGQYRRVNVSKDGFPFAAAVQVPAMMDQFERDILRRCTPCTFADRAEVVRALAGTKKNAYIAAIQAGLDRHYVPMESLLREIIEQSGLSS